MFRTCASSKFVNEEGKHARRRAGRLLSRMQRLGTWKEKFPGGKTVGKANCLLELEQTTSTVYLDFMWLSQCKLVLKTNKKQTKPTPSLIFMMLRQVYKHDLYISDGIQLAWVWILHNILSLSLSHNHFQAYFLDHTVLWLYHHLFPQMKNQCQEKNKTEYSEQAKGKVLISITVIWTKDCGRSQCWGNFLWLLSFVGKGDSNSGQCCPGEETSWAPDTPGTFLPQLSLTCKACVSMPSATEYILRRAHKNVYSQKDSRSSWNCSNQDSTVLTPKIFPSRLHVL